MKTYLILFFTFFPQMLFSQNLVPNPSFEELRNEKDLETQATCTASAGYHEEEKKANIMYWLSILYMTETTFLSTNAYLLSTKTKNKSYHIDKAKEDAPRSGESCFQFINTTDFKKNTLVMVRLKEPLQKGKTYYASFWVKVHKRTHIVCNNFGMYFTDTLLTYQEIKQNSIEPFIVPDINEGRIVDDTLKWTCIKGKFKARSNARYLSIGNFFAREQTLSKLLILNNYRIRDDNGVYYLDDVYVGLEPERKRKRK